MKHLRIFAALICLFCLFWTATAQAANPAFGSFNTDQFATAGGTGIWIPDGAKFTNIVAQGITNLGYLNQTGQVYASIGSAAAPAYSFGAETNTGVYRSAANRIGFSILGTLGAEMNAANGGMILTLASSGVGGAFAMGSAPGSPDVVISRDGPGVWAQKNAASPQTNRVYKAVFGTPATNQAFLEIGYDIGNGWYFMRTGTNVTGTSTGTNAPIVLSIGTNILDGFRINTNGTTTFGRATTNLAEAFNPTNVAPINFIATNFIPSSGFSGTRYTNLNQRSMLLVSLSFTEAVGGTPVARAVIEQNGAGGAKTNTFFYSMPSGVASVTTNTVNLGILNPNAVVVITDISGGSGASVGVPNSVLELQ